MLILHPEGQLRSGKCGSLTFSKKGYVSPTKIHSLPRNHKNTIVQSNMAFCHNLWLEVARTAPENIIAWNTFTINLFNRIGNPITLKGKSAFMRLNMNLLNSNQPPLFGVTSDLVAPSVSLFNVSIVSHANHMFITIPVDSSLTAVNIYASDCYSTGKVSADDNQFRKIATLNFSSVSTHAIYTNYKNVFGGLNHLANISFRIQAISKSGVPSIVSQLNRIVT